jgi:DNA gyrase subunit B
MCDADVDGAHIRTLVLTFLFREMPELIEAGYVYLAKAPLYKVKSGKNDLYIEKESELEEFLLRDKLEKMEVHDRTGTQFKLTHSRWQKYVRLLKQYEGWASSLRAEFGYPTVSFLEESHVLDGGATDVDGVIGLLRGEDPEGEPFSTERPTTATSCACTTSCERWRARRRSASPSARRRATRRARSRSCARLCSRWPRRA